MTTYTDRITSKPMQVQSLNESARRGLVHALLTTYQRHMNNPLPPPPAMGEGLRLRGWNEPSDDELISMHQERLTDFYMRYCREFRVEVPVIPSGHVIDADGFLREAKKLIETLLWSRVYDLLEFWMARYPGPSKLADRLAERIDAVLKRENVDHRIVDRKFVPVSDDIEKEAVASATDATNVSAHVRTHIDKGSGIHQDGRLQAVRARVHLRRRGAVQTNHGTTQGYAWRSAPSTRRGMAQGVSSVLLGYVWMEQRR